MLIFTAQSTDHNSVPPPSSLHLPPSASICFRPPFSLHPARTVVLPCLCPVLPCLCPVLPCLYPVLPCLCPVLPCLCPVLPCLCPVLPCLYPVLPCLCPVLPVPSRYPSAPYSASSFCYLQPISSLLSLLSFLPSPSCFPLIFRSFLLTLVLLIPLRLRSEPEFRLRKF